MLVEKISDIKQKNENLIKLEEEKNISLEQLRENLIKYIINEDWNSAKLLVTEIYKGEYGPNITLENLPLYEDTQEKKSVIHEIMEIEGGKYNEEANLFGYECQSLGYIEHFFAEY